MNYDLRVVDLPYQSYVVCCRADTFKTTMCHHTIVQNTRNVHSENDHFIPHWPQPGLIKRSTSSGKKLQTLTYMGSSINLWSPLRSVEFSEKLRDIGIDFKINVNPSDFHDYRECDAVLAVRDLTESDYNAKPASKLINAWHAGVPALLGPEPAFQALRRSELDYLDRCALHKLSFERSSSLEKVPIAITRWF